jgi:hypothetical protein
MEMQRDGHLPILNIDIYRRHDDWAVRYILNLLVLTFVSTMFFITHPTSMPYFPHWCTGLELCMIRTAFMQS